VDWDLCDGRLGLPVLAAPLDEVIASGELTLDTVDADGSGPERVLRYHEHVFPLTDGTHEGASDNVDIADLAAGQHYLLGSWREKERLLAHRRFFDVDTLIAVRVEDPAVFDATHAVLLDLHRRGVLDGFRIDHPDGLADPEGYLARLAETSDGAWVVVEKILERSERLPARWATAGTTGYDACSVIQTALAPTTGAELDSLWREVGTGASLAQTELSAKRQVLSELLSPELERLLRLVHRAADEAHLSVGDPATVRGALVEILVHVAVYRAYLRPGHQADDESVEQLVRMVHAARQAKPELAAELDLLHRLLGDVASSSEAGRDLVVRFQQVCGPVMAKGVEDTTFYRWNRLIVLNEVGGDPQALDSPGPEGLHAWAAYQQEHWPLGMTTLSTHDTKRSEDLRARLLAVAADSDAWTQSWQHVAAKAARHGVDGPTAYLLFQTLLGGWPLDSTRLAGYAEKAMREAKVHTSWQSPDERYERRVQALVTDCLADAALTGRLAEVIAGHSSSIAALTLAAKLIQLTLPGVPDVYQGCETVSLSLVDPDNRRPVDFGMLSDRLSRLDTTGPDPSDLDDAKLWVTAQALRLRRDEPGLFGRAARYRKVETSSDVIAFTRSVGDKQLVTAARVRRGDPGLSLPEATWRDLLTGRVHEGGHADASIFAVLPVALLVRESR
jgi:(1->4)-alpha-D-glucan 1-alpha-D-glucosylmutase